MGLFNNFPYTDFHRLNLDWILKFTKSVRDRLDLIDAAVANAQAARDAAEQSALKAESARDIAVQAASDAEDFKTAAQQSAGSALDSKTAAEAAQLAAQQAAQDAENAKDAAEDARDRAETAASTATTAIENINDYVDAAEQAAQNAGNSAQAAEDAKTDAETAQAAAEAAAGSVDPSGNIYVVHVSNAPVYDLDASNKSFVCADSPAFDHYNLVAQNHAPVYAVPHFTNAGYNLVLSGNKYMSGRYVPQWHVVDAVGNDVTAGSLVSFDIYLIPQTRCTESRGTNYIPS